MHDPGFTLLLDRGLIIARRGGLDGMFIFDGRDGMVKPFSLDFYAYRWGGEWAIWEPEVSEGKSGRSLLWLYFAIVAQLNLSARGNQGTILDFTNQVARDFPMVLKSGLRTAEKW
jgi:hypothetical protein